jgi:hypothetical protein
MKHLLVMAGACLALLLAATPSLAHQSDTSNGITVTMHIAPGDEPVAGQPATIVFISAKRRGWSLRRGSCGCRIRVTDSSGDTLLDRRTGARETRLTFPRAGAYRVRISGRLKREGRTKSFNASFTYRAS